MLKNIFNIEIKNLKELSFIINSIINNFILNRDSNLFQYLFKLIKGNNNEQDYTNEYLIFIIMTKFIIT